MNGVAIDPRTGGKSARVAGRTAIYCRISDDGDGRGLGVERQVEDCLRLATMLGLVVDPADVIVENDKGASIHSTKPRPLYERLIARCASGEVTHVLAYSLSRLTRRMVEREELLIDLRALGVSFTTTQGQRIYPTMSAVEVQMIRMVGVNDTAESDQISERVRRANDQSAKAGMPHGPIAYGWDRSRERNGVVVDTLNEDQANVIREAARRLLAGESTRGIATDFNARGIPAPRGGAWSAVTLAKIMLRERNAARRVHRGVVVGPAAWSPIYDDATHDAVIAHYADPARGTGRGASSRQHLMSGLLVCGACGGDRVWIAVPTAKRAESQGFAYGCRDCHRNKRRQNHVDEFVTEAVCARLARSDALDWLASDAGVLDAARDRLTALRGSLAERVDMFDAGELTRDQFVRSNMRLTEQIAEAERAVEAARPVPSAVRTMVGHGSVEATRAVWDTLTEDQRRDVIRTLVVVTLVKTGTRKFTAECIRLDWRTDVADAA